MVGSHKLEIRELSSSSVYHEALSVDQRARFLLAHWAICIAHESMNMHPGDRRSIEENEGADSAQKEKTTPLGHSRSSEMTKTPIHIEAEVGFLVGLLISRLRWVLFVYLWV